MIKIERVSTDSDPIQTYRVTINDKYITKFRHNPEFGLAECLREAADEIDSTDYRNEV